MRNVKVYNNKTESYDMITVYESTDYLKVCDKLKMKIEVINGYRKSYKKIYATFDIETTSIIQNDESSGFMYIWQMCIDGIVVIGRTWQEFIDFLEMLKKTLYLGYKTRLVIYVHYLPFEFQFFRNFFEIERVFAVSKRQVVTVHIMGFEFRCSYKLTNMSLDRFCKSSKNCKHFKKSGTDFNYKICRTPTTYINDNEMEYVICDVLGLWESLQDFLETDTLVSIPLTSTGFVRRNYREKMLENPYNKKLISDTQLNPIQYAYLKECLRGGNTHANPTYANMIMENGVGFDKKSSYPASMILDKFPMTKFKQVNPKEEYTKEYACIIDITFKGIKVRHLHGVPYISKNKVGLCIGGKYDNGRIISANEVRMCITDIDYKIIVSHYNFTDFDFHHMEIADYDYLPLEFRENLLLMFNKKEKLRNGDRYMYNKYKNLINSSFGMMLTDILNSELVYNGNKLDSWEEVKKDPFSGLEKYYSSSKSFLAYQWGVFVTAHARAELQKGIDIVANEEVNDLLYVDTDSVYTIGNHTQEFDLLNNELIKKAQSIQDIQSFIEIDGNAIYLGVWEVDCYFRKFKTLGAKKYIKEDDNGNISLTLSGVSKELGSKYFQMKGIEKFAPSTVIPHKYSGRTTHHYRDLVGLEKIHLNGEEIIRGSSIGIEESVYSLGITQEYKDLLDEIHEI